jgi:hypothetical protein
LRKPHKFHASSRTLKGWKRKQVGTTELEDFELRGNAFIPPICFRCYILIEDQVSIPSRGSDFFLSRNMDTATQPRQNNNLLNTEEKQKII